MPGPEIEAKEKILLVDDDESLRDLCSVALKSEGYQISICESGDAAIKNLENNVYDAVLTDFQMPGKTDGHGVVRAVKSRWPSTEVIVMTGMPTLQTAIATLKDGAYDYIIKPFRMDEFSLLVRRCMDYRRLRKDLISEKAVRKELEDAYQELQKVEQIKESFLSRLSHEIRTPLSQVLIALQILEETTKEKDSVEVERLQKYLELARSGATRLDKTLMDLLAFVDLQSRQELAASAPVDLKSLLMDTVDQLRPLWEPRNLRVDVELAFNAPRIDGDCALLSQAFQHLIHNAIIFNRENGAIAIRGEIKGEYIEISVSDTGEGIPEEEFDKIFDSFYQIATYLTRKVEGLGLGLAITRRIIEAHKGQIRVSSRVGEGTTFKVFLPVAAPQLAGKPL